MNIFVDAKMSDDERRKELYDGAIFFHSASPSALKLCQLAREMAEEAFGSVDPRRAQEAMPAEKAAEILGALKPKFIHHPRSKECIQGILRELDCDPEATYFDVPRLRTAFPGDYLKSGIAYAFHPHRDTWYSAPYCQINWWMPVYPITADNCMAIHPHYFDEPIKNGSAGYNYQRWNQESRFNAAQQVKADTRIQPKPEEDIELDPQFRLISEPGALYQFSAAHLHSTVPNSTDMTRYSIDFRTVQVADVWSRIGAANVDSACTGSSIVDFLRGTDFSRLPDEAVALYMNGTEIVGKSAIHVA